MNAVPPRFIRWIASSTRNKLVVAMLAFLVPLAAVLALFVRLSADAMEKELRAMAGDWQESKRKLANESLEAVMIIASYYQSDAVFSRLLHTNYDLPIDSLDLYEQIWSRSNNILSVYPGIRRITLYSENPTLTAVAPYVLRVSGGFEETPAYRGIMENGYGYWSRALAVRRDEGYWDAYAREAGAGNPSGHANPVVAEPVSADAGLAGDGGAPSDGSGARYVSYTAPIPRAVSPLAARGYRSFVCIEFDAEQLDIILGSAALGSSAASATATAEGLNAVADGPPAQGRVLSAFVDADNSPVEPGSRIEAFLSILPAGNAAVRAREYNLDGTAYLVWQDPLINGWKLVSVAPVEQVTRTAYYIRRVGMAFMVMFAVGFVATVLLISNRFLNRALSVAARMEAFDVATWEPAPPLPGMDEISAIDRSFAAMAANLRDSIRQNYTQAIERKQAELSRLHTQIRPHFLYNMLSSLAWAIDEKPRPVVRKAIENLAAFYRYSLSRGNEIIKLREELRIVAAYVDLQKVRFADRVCFISRVDPVFHDVELPKMTLQALVENSILYGPGEERRLVSVLLDAAFDSDGSVVLTLRDDGVGIEPEQLSRMRNGESESNSGAGIGYKTVSERVALYFGPGYGLDIESELGNGTAVHVRLPAPEWMTGSTDMEEGMDARAPYEPDWDADADENTEGNTMIKGVAG